MSNDPFLLSDWFHAIAAVHQAAMYLTIGVTDLCQCTSYRNHDYTHNTGRLT